MPLPLGVPLPRYHRAMKTCLSPTGRRMSTRLTVRSVVAAALLVLLVLTVCAGLAACGGSSDAGGASGGAPGAATAAAGAATAAGAPERPVIGPDGETVPGADVVYRDVAYGTTSPLQKLDVYLPDNGERPYPVLVAIHGGGFSARRQGGRPDHPGAGRPHARLRRGRAGLPAQPGGHVPRGHQRRQGRRPLAARPRRRVRPGRVPRRALGRLGRRQSRGARRHLRRLERPARPGPGRRRASPTRSRRWSTGSGPSRSCAPTATSATPASTGRARWTAGSFLSVYLGAPLAEVPGKVRAGRPDHVPHARRPADPHRARHGGRHRAVPAVGAAGRGLREGGRRGQRDAAPAAGRRPRRPGRSTRSSTSPRCSTGWTPGSSRRAGCGPCRAHDDGAVAQVAVVLSVILLPSSA